MRPAGAWRLYAAAAVCLLSLGLVWSTSLDFGPTLAYTLPYTYTDADGYSHMMPSYSQVEYRANGVDFIPGFRSDARVVLVPAAVVLAWAATHRTALNRRLSRASVVGLLGLLAIALSRGRVQASVATVAALWLALPVVCPDWVRRLSRRGIHAARSVPAERPVGPPATGSAF